MSAMNDDNKKLYRCKCGRSRVYAFRQPSPCQPCGWCGTNLAESRALCAPAIDHELYQEEYVLDEKGEQIIICEICKFCNTLSPLLDSRSNPTIAVIN